MSEMVIGVHAEMVMINVCGVKKIKSSNKLKEDLQGMMCKEASA